MKFKDQIRSERDERVSIVGRAKARVREAETVIRDLTRNTDRAAELEAVASLVNLRRSRGLWRWEPLTMRLNPDPNTGIQVEAAVDRGGRRESLTAGASLSKEQTIAVQEHLSAIADILTDAAKECAEKALAASEGLLAGGEK